jgi:hypothetical protein
VSGACAYLDSAPDFQYLGDNNAAQTTLFPLYQDTIQPNTESVRKIHALRRFAHKPAKVNGHFRS